MDEQTIHSADAAPTRIRYRAIVTGEGEARELFVSDFCNLSDAINFARDFRNADRWTRSAAVVEMRETNDSWVPSVIVWQREASGPKPASTLGDLLDVVSPLLYDAETNEPIGPATSEQIAASLSAKPTGGILVDRDGDVVEEGSWAAQQPGVRTVYVRERG